MKFIIDGTEEYGFDYITVTITQEINWDADYRMCFIFGDGTGFYGYPKQFLKYKERREAILGIQEYLVEDEEDFGTYDYSFEIKAPGAEGQVFMPDIKKDDRF